MQSKNSTESCTNFNQKRTREEPTSECTTAKEGIVNQGSELLHEINKEEIKAAFQRVNILIDGIKVGGDGACQYVLVGQQNIQQMEPRYHHSAT